jgi:predicted transport protein
MPLFSIHNNTLNIASPLQFDKEKELQSLVESNLDTVFSCNFIATEFRTGATHGGRIDTLALTEDGNPCIIEYKKVESSELINQSLFYLSWLDDHRGDYQVAAETALGANIEIDWADIRVICLAPGYKKYDLHAVHQMGANIELWKYRLFDNKNLLLEEIYRRPSSTSNGSTQKKPKLKNPNEAVAYSWEYHLARGTSATNHLGEQVRDFCLSLSDSVEESPKKFYVAYKVAKNFCCLEFQKKRAILYLRLDPSAVKDFPDNIRDVKAIGHYGTGDLEVTIATAEHFEIAKPLIEQAFNAVGGS